MPRPRATGTAARNDVDQPKSAWKDKLTEQQLSRKRATDRQLVRENRNRARRTIALLQERIELLSNQQPDRVIADLLQENTNLEREKGALKDRLQSIYIAVGISREDTHELISKSASEDTESSSSGCKSGVDNSGPLEIPPPPPSNPQNGKNIVIGSNNEHEQLPECQNEQDLVRELNLRTALPGFPSPFPGIYANMDQISGVVNFCDDEFIESIMLWKLRYPSASSVFELASHLYHVHRPPNRLTQNKLSLITSTPSLLQLLIDDLDSPQLGLDLAATTPPSLVVPDTSVTTVKRELIVCAFEAIRPWKYRSRLARITMFWALYRILNLLMFPTAKNLAKCPIWYRPLLVQMWHPHAAFLDFIPWPGIRAQLVQDWRSYERRNLFSAFVEDFDIQHPLPFCPGRLIHLNADSTVLELDSGLEKHLQNLSSLGMHRGFVEKFPEFARFVHVIGTDNDHTTDSHVSVNKTQLPSRRVPPEIASEPDSLISDDGGQPNQHLPDIASTYRISTAVSVPDSNLLPGPGTTQDPALTFTFDKTIVPADFTEEFQPNDNQSCRESVRTLSTSQDTAGLNEPRDFLSTDPFAQVVNQPSSSQKDGALGDFNPPLNLGYGYDSYQLDPSLTEWELPVPWSMQLDGSGLKDFLFSV